ncbi:MAG: hypothetical protein H6737_09375 [Alphaproteobacteria bacterium]|nr:hypothetical protein [Alphaproteobacteria bacterium]
MRPTLAVIDPGTRVPELDCYNRISRNSPLPTTYHLPAQHGMDSLERVQGHTAGVVILGSGASVNDREPWQVALNAWLTARLDTLPMLGLCYGHQLLAHLLGGEVGWLYEDRTKLKGVRQVPLMADRLWGDAQTGPMIVSHAEVVKRLPDGCALRGASDVCPVEAFAHQRLPLWGFQPHPEATPAFAANNNVPFTEDPAILAFGHGIVDRFSAFVADR